MNIKKLPPFRREDRHKKVRMKGGWRRPKGIHSKMRHAFKGRAPVVSVGYIGKASERGLTAEGKSIEMVFNTSQLGLLDSSKASIIIGSAVGGKKRIQIMDAAAKSNFKILNIKDTKKYSESINKEFAARKSKRAEQVAKKQQKQKVKKEEKLEDKTEEEKKQEGIAEQEKILTQKQ